MHDSLADLKTDDYPPSDNDVGILQSIGVNISKGECTGQNQDPDPSQQQPAVRPKQSRLRRPNKVEFFLPEDQQQSPDSTFSQSASFFSRENMYRIGIATSLFYISSSTTVVDFLVKFLPNRSAVFLVTGLVFAIFFAIAQALA